MKPKDLKKFIELAKIFDIAINETNVKKYQKSLSK